MRDNIPYLAICLSLRHAVLLLLRLRLVLSCTHFYYL